MKTLKNKILSGFLSLAMLISPLSSVAFAEGADTTADTPSVVYTFDASTFPIESGTTASVSVSDYGITPASTSAKIWSTVVENSDNSIDEKAIRYSTRNIKQEIGALMTHKFANDQKNTPTDSMDNGKYVVEHLFTPLVKCDYLDVDIDGNNGIISKLRIDNNNTSGGNTNAYLINADGETLGDKLNFQINSTSSKFSAYSILYLKTEIDLTNSTYTTYLKVAKTLSSTLDTTVDDSNILVSDQPFYSDNNNITGITYITNNTSGVTQGVWSQKTVVSKLPTAQATGTPAETAEPTDAPVPTATPEPADTPAPTDTPVPTDEPSDNKEKEVYKLDVSTFTPDIKNAVTVSDYGIAAASTSSVLWGTVAENSANTWNETGLRYSIRSIKNAGVLMTHTFANDKTNPPTDTMENGTYAVEHIFTPLIREGYLDININGNNGDIAKLRIDGKNGVGAKTNAYMADSTGTAIGDNKLNFQVCNSSDAGKPGSVLYTRTEINLTNNTYTTYLKVAKSATATTLDTTVTDSDILVKDQAFNSENDKIVSISYDMQNTSTYTQAVWTQKTAVKSIPTSAEPTAAPTAEPTATPTVAPTAEPTAAPTVAPTDTPTPTAAVNPTDTPKPTDTPNPTATVKPTDTPTVTVKPTDTPKPADTPEPSDTPKPTTAATAEPAKTAPPLNGTVVMNESYTEKTPAEYGWAVLDDTYSSNGTMTASADGISFKKTTAVSTDNNDKYAISANFSKYQTAKDANSSTYTISADGKAAIEFDAKFDISDSSGAGSAIYLDIMGSGIASGNTTTGLMSLGRIRVKPSGSLNAYAAKNVNGSSSDTVLTADSFTGKWHNLQFVYDLSAKTYNIYVDGEKVNSTALKATNWSERTSTILLNGLSIELSKDLAADSTLSIKNVKVTQISTHEKSTSEKAADTIAKIADDQTKVISDLSLPTSVSGFSDLAIEWSSSNTDAVSNDGKITRSTEDQTATLTAKITDANKYIVYKEFPVTIAKVDNVNSDDMIISRAKAYMEMYQITSEKYNDITRDLDKIITSYHDASSDKDVAIAWTSSNTSLISDDGKYLAGEKPEQTSTVTMTATLTIGEEKAVVTYTLTINKHTGEKLILSADFSDTSAWKYFDKTSAVNSFDNVSAVANNGKFVITKKSVSGETDYSERYRSMYSFRQYDEEYNAQTRTATYSVGLNGQFKIVSNATHHITSGSQFQVENLAFGASDESITYPFPLAINSSKVFNYNDQDNPIYTGNITDKATDFTYTIDTESGEFTVAVGNSDKYTQTVDPATLQGIVYVIKNQAKAGDSITVNSIKVYSLNGTPARNPLAETAAKLTMANVTNKPEAVSESLTLPETVGDASIAWTSSDTKLIANDGTIGQLPIDGDKDVVLTAKITNGTDTIYKDFHVTISKESDPTVILKKDMALVTSSTLTSANTDNLSTNLTLPTTGKYGSTITWKSSDTDYITDDGKIVKLGSKTHPEVTMTATFTYEGVSLTKEFNFKIAINFEDGLFTVYETNTVGDTITSNITTDGGGTISAAGGKITLNRQNASGTDTTSVSIKPTFDGKEIAMTREFVFETDITIPDANTKFEIIPKDANGNRITTIYSGNENGSKAYFTYVPSDDTGTAQHIKEYYTPSSTPTNLKFKFHVDPKAGTFELQYSLNGEAYKALSYNGNTTMNMREASSSLAYFEINAPYNTNDKIDNKGYITINNAAVSTNKAFILDMARDQVNYTAPVTSTGGYISDNIDFNVGSFPGTTAKWTSSNPSIFSNDGVINRDNLKANTDIELTFTLTLNADSEVVYTETIPVTIVYIDPFNLSNGKKTESNANGTSGHDASKATDGLFTTSWQTSRLEENTYIIADLEGNEAVSAVILSEAEIFGRYNVTGYTIETSTDKQKWTTVYTGKTLGENTVTASFDPVVAKYVKYTVTSKEAGNTGLNEIQVLVGQNDKEIANAENKYLTNTIGSLRGIKSSINLPEAKYGATVKYESSIPDYFSNTGVVKRDSTKTITGVLKVTTTYNGTTTVNEIPITIPPASSSSGSGGGGGGGTPVNNKNNSTSSSSSSSSTGGLPAFPTEPTFENIIPADNSVFKDVPQSHWAYTAIKDLKEKDVVAGDENGNFNPQANVSRQEFVKMLISALNIDLDSNAEMSFDDVSDSDWSYKYIRKAVELNIVYGVSDTMFDKTSNITRQDMAVMCTRALSVIGNDISSDAELNFTDKDNIASYAAPSVAAMQAKGIISGYEDGSFLPQNNAARCEAAKIISELIKLEG